MKNGKFVDATVADTKRVTSTESRLRSIRSRNKLLKPKSVGIDPGSRYDRHPLISCRCYGDDDDDHEIGGYRKVKQRFGPPTLESSVWAVPGEFRPSGARRKQSGLSPEDQGNI